MGLTREDKILRKEVKQKEKGTFGWRAKKIGFGMAETAIGTMLGPFGVPLMLHGGFKVARGVTGL